MFCFSFAGLLNQSSINRYTSGALLIIFLSVSCAITYFLRIDVLRSFDFEVEQMLGNNIFKYGIIFYQINKYYHNTYNQT
jgi:hypothetical protein